MRLTTTHLKTASRLARRNPALLWEKLCGKLRALRPRPASPYLGKIQGVVFEFDFDLGPAVTQMYFGTYQPEVFLLMRRFMRPGDTFVDVGANIGYLSALGMGLVGASGEVHSFEPVPQYA